jgi:hypothetical protein
MPERQGPFKAKPDGKTGRMPGSARPARNVRPVLGDFGDSTADHLGISLDFVSLHFYPKQGEVDKALKALAVCQIGKPMVIEEMFPLSCSVAELDQFIEGSKPLACGWIGFYWGKTIAEYKQQKGGIAEAMALDWLEYFARKSP